MPRDILANSKFPGNSRQIRGEILGNFKENAWDDLPGKCRDIAGNSRGKLLGSSRVNVGLPGFCQTISRKPMQFHRVLKDSGNI